MVVVVLFLVLWIGIVWWQDRRTLVVLEPLDESGEVNAAEEGKDDREKDRVVISSL